MHFIIADNQALTAEGVRSLLRQILGGCSTEDAADHRTLRQALERHPASAVILDYSRFDFSGVEMLEIFLKRFSESCWLLLADGLSERFVRTLSQYSQVGFVRKEDDRDELQHALRALSEGRGHRSRFFQNLLAHSANDEPQVLTQTEREVLRLIAEGKQSKEIAAQRNSSIHTIITHRKNIFRKLGVNNQHEATKYALRAGILDPVEYYI